MARYEIFIKPSALRELEDLATKKARRRIVRAINALSQDPRPHGSRKLSGRDKYRIRTGAFRILYEIQDPHLTVTVVKIGHRREVYR